MRQARALWRLLRASAHVLHGLWLVATRFPALDAPARHRRVQWWSAKLLRTLGVTLQVDGAGPGGAVLLVANHVSWLDIAAIHAAAPQVRFVSKADVMHWPLLGRLVAGAGTLFIERDSKRDALRVVHRMADALRAGDAVAVFPEGTTGEGRTLLPFHANLLQAAVATCTPVQPALLRYHEPGQAFSAAVVFVGQTTLVQSIWRLVCADALAVQLQWLPAQPSAGAERRQLAQALRHAMAEALSAVRTSAPGSIPMSEMQPGVSP